MFARLLILFIVVPAVELKLLIVLFEKTYWQFGLGLILLTGILGSALAKIQGLKTWLAIKNDLAQGRIPADGVVHGLLILIAGALLLTPGLLTDAVGFLLLIPPTRTFIGTRVKAWFAKKVSISPPSFGDHQKSPAHEEENDAITVDAEVIDDDK